MLKTNKTKQTNKSLYFVFWVISFQEIISFLVVFYSMLIQKIRRYRIIANEATLLETPYDIEVNNNISSIQYQKMSPFGLQQKHCIFRYVVSTSITLSTFWKLRDDWQLLNCCKGVSKYCETEQVKWNNKYVGRQSNNRRKQG